MVLPLGVEHDEHLVPLERLQELGPELALALGEARLDRLPNQIVQRLARDDLAELRCRNARIELAVERLGQSGQIPVLGVRAARGIGIDRAFDELVESTVDAYAARGAHPEDWDLAGLTEALHRQFDTRIPAAEFSEVVSREALDDLVREAVKARFAERERELGPELLQALERHEMLIVLDTQWKDHLLSIDHLKEGIGLRGYGQRDPLTEYKKEAFDLFEDMFERMKAAVIERLFKVQIVRDAPMELPAMTAWADARESRGEVAGEPARSAAAPAPRTQAVPRTPTGEKIGRNDPCYCGSGKKYKKCHYLKS